MTGIELDIDDNSEEVVLVGNIEVDVNEAREDVDNGEVIASGGEI